ncbi:MAG: carbohydrate kinase, partial [Lachnospiraceae bacterium]|nr:carbohydrate kinase [Lachnospiraceae bacterium]
MQKFDVVALGELLVDFTENGKSAQGNTLFEANPGGAPCNVLSMLQRLGKRTAFIGKVGKDSFGEMLRAVVAEQGIDTGNVIADEGVPTTLAFVHTASDGDRSFSFYRNPGADMMLLEEDIDISLLENTHIFHFGSLSMTDDGVEK